MLTTRALPHISLKASGADIASVGEEGTTSRRIVGIVGRTLRICGANGVVVALSVVGEPENKRILAAIVRIGEKAMQWSGEASRNMRSVTEHQEWLLEQVGGGLTRNVFDIFAAIGETDFLVAAEFVPVKSMEQNEKEAQLANENEFAMLAGRFAMCLGRNQLQRFLWLFGYPHKLSLVLQGGARGQAVMDEFKANKDNFDRLGQAHGIRIATEYYKRSQFQKSSVQHLTLVTAELAYTMHHEIKALLDQRTRTIMSTGVVEHLNNAQKNSREMTN